MSYRPQLLPLAEPRTELARDRVSSGPHYVASANGEQDTFKGRPIIDRDSRINGGIYLGGHGREAIVVDDEKQPKLKQAYDMLRAKLIREHIPRYEVAVIKGELRHKPATTFDPMSAAIEAYRYTQQLIPTGKEFANSLAVKYEDDRKIALSAFYGKSGVCRHHALNNAYFIEKMIDQELLTGEVHVERNSTDAGAHAWARFTPEFGEPIILDTTQNFVGTVSVAEQNAYWDYTPTPVQQ